jgi:hypothetical protein
MAEKVKTIYAALLLIQQGVKAPKSEKGYGYDYRTTDGILKIAKPLMAEAGVICTLSDESMQVGNRYYVKATATLIDIATGDSISASGVAVEPDKLASMAPPQITGTSSTYARKRALEGLFLLDNEKDVDSTEVQDAIQNAQNTPQKTETTSKGKTTKATTKTQGEANDTVKTQIINKAIAEVQRLKLSDEKVSEIIYKHYKMKISSWSDLQEKQIIEMTENLEKWAHELHVSTAWGEDEGALNQ